MSTNMTGELSKKTPLQIMNTKDKQGIDRRFQFSDVTELGSLPAASSWGGEQNKNGKKNSLAAAAINPSLWGPYKRPFPTPPYYK